MLNDINKNNFESCREVKWCPGCGNYSILTTMQKTLHSIGLSTKDVVFISGIGCSGRFPYYINTYGFHTLHGRAPAVATGLKLARPDLNVWLVIGDGDGFSIGLGHILHLFRRNIDINILFINNGIYALTKGQYSPTSNNNFITKSSPFGSIEKPINPINLALNVGCSFVARTIDNDFKNFKDIIIAAIKHKGTSFIEVLQNCNIFNNNIYYNLTNKETKDEKILYLNNDKPLIYGKKNKYYLTINKQLEFTSIDYNNIDANNIIHHTINNKNIIQDMLSNITYNDTPYPVGIFRSINTMTYDDIYQLKIKQSKKINTFSDIFC